MSRQRATIGLIGLTLGLLTAWPEAQTPTFRVGADLIEIDAVVTGKGGVVARGLSKDDFQVSEDGKPQELLLFSFVDIPVPKPAPAAAPTAVDVRPDVSTNTKAADSRLYVIVLDGFHVDSSRSTTVRKLARQFIADSMGPNDLAAVLILGKGAANQQFTSNKTLLDATVDQFIGQKSRSAAINTSLDSIVRMGGNQDMQSAGEDAEAGAKASEARIALESLKQVCERLGTSDGYRRSLVLFAEGIEVDTSDLIGEDKRPSAGGKGLKYETSKHAGDILQAQQDLFVAARRANVAIYAVDPRGSTIGADMTMMPLGKTDGNQAASAPPTLAVKDETQRGQGTLRTFAEQTGGLAVVNTNNITGGFSQIVQANSSYYVLGYRPQNVARDGAYHKISVGLKPPNLEVTARKGYYAPLDAKPGAPAPTSTEPVAASASPSPAAASPRMRELLASSLPVAGLGLRVVGGPVRNQGDKVLVALVVEIDTKDLLFGDQNGLLSNDIEMAFLAMDSQGKMQAANRSVGNLRLPPAQRSAVTQGLRYVVEFPVAPGRYQVRVAAHESAGDRGGSALLDVDAPAFNRSPLSIATVLLTTQTAQIAPTTGYYPTLKALLPTPPTAAREFAAQDVLTAFINVLGSEIRKGSVALTMVVRTEDGREAFKNEIPLGSNDLSPDKTAYAHLAQIPLAGLAPARYVLAFTARTTNGKSATESIPFAVR